MGYEYNFVGIAIGSPGFGKTFLTRKLIAQHIASHPRALVIVHDPNRQFLEDGAAWYDDTDAWRKAMELAAKEKRPVPRVSSMGGDALQCTRLAFELGEKLRNTAKDVKAPVLVAFDEGSLHNERTYMSNENNLLLATRRHRGVGMLFLCQDMSQLVGAFFKMSTDCYVFRMREEQCIRLASLINVDKADALRAVDLPKYKHIHLRSHEGLVQQGAK